MTGRITKRTNLEGVTPTQGLLLVSPLANRCRSHTGKVKPTRDPYTSNRCKPLRRSANAQHKPCAYFLGRTVYPTMGYLTNDYLKQISESVDVILHIVFSPPGGLLARGQA